MTNKYSKTSVVIEDPSTDEWAVSFTSHNPEREDCIDCKTEADAWRLKHIYDQTRAALTKACDRIADGHQTYEEAATAEMWADRFLSEANGRDQRRPTPDTKQNL